LRAAKAFNFDASRGVFEADVDGELRSMKLPNQRDLNFKIGNLICQIFINMVSYENGGFAWFSEILGPHLFPQSLELQSTLRPMEDWSITIYSSQL